MTHPMPEAMRVAGDRAYECHGRNMGDRDFYVRKTEAATLFDPLLANITDARREAAARGTALKQEREAGT